MTAIDIYEKITSKSVTKEMGIKLIENYGLQHERLAGKRLLKDTPLEMQIKMSETINRISAKLDELLENTVEAYKK